MRGVIRVALIAVALLGTLAAPVAAGPFEDGVAAYGRADYSTAFQLFRRLAEQGDASAQFNLGHVYNKGQAGG